MMQQIKLTYPDGRDAGMHFTEHLTNAMLNGQLVLGLHNTGDWLKLLTIDELGKLAQLVERTFSDPDNLHPDLPHVVLNLVVLETANTRAAVSLDEMPHMMQCLLMMCQVETDVRQGYIKIEGQWRITDQADENHYASLTAQGYQAADQPGASAFLKYLKRLTGSPRWN